MSTFLRYEPIDGYIHNWLVAGPEAVHDHLRIYNQVCEHMGCRTLLEDGLGVLWDSESGRRVFFSYREGTLSLEGKAPVHRVTPQGMTDLGTLTEIAAGEEEAYLIG